jgi:hypothetical protein
MNQIYIFMLIFMIVVMPIALFDRSMIRRIPLRNRIPYIKLEHKGQRCHDGCRLNEYKKMG